MNPSHAEEIIQEYLRKVEAELGTVPAEQRDEIVDDLRAHIDEAIGNPERATEADVRNVLERLGDPATLAAEARTRSDAGLSPVSTAPTTLSKRPGVLEIVAIVLTALFWPVGVVLAWASDRWRTRDKVVATLIPAISTFMLIAIAVGGLFAFTSAESTIESTQVVSTQSEQVETGGTAPIEESTAPDQSRESGTNSGELVRTVIVFGFLGLSAAGPLIAALFLAIRLQPVEVSLDSTGSREIGRIPAGGSI